LVWHAHPARGSRARRPGHVVTSHPASAGVQVIEIQNCVEDERITSGGLSAPEWIHRKRITDPARAASRLRQRVARFSSPPSNRPETRKFVGVAPAQNPRVGAVGRNQQPGYAAALHDRGRFPNFR
jgi:hypothetical protein